MIRAPSGLDHPAARTTWSGSGYRAMIRKGDTGMPRIILAFPADGAAEPSASPP